MQDEQLKQFYQLPVKPNLEKGKTILARLAKKSSWMEKVLLKATIQIV